MVSAYVGTCLVLPVFGFLANHIGAFLYPPFLLTILVLIVVMHEWMLPIVRANKDI